MSSSTNTDTLVRSPEPIPEARPMAGSYAPGRPGWKPPHKDAQHASPGPDYAGSREEASHRAHRTGDGLADGAEGVRTAEARLARDQALAEHAAAERQHARRASNSSSDTSNSEDEDAYRRRHRHHARSGGLDLEERREAAIAGGLKPTAADKIIGRVEMVTGKAFGKPGMQEKGEIRVAAGKKVLREPY